MKFSIICGSRWSFFRGVGAEAVGVAVVQGRARGRRFIAPHLSAVRGSDGRSAVVEMGLAVKEKCRAGLTHVAGGTQ